MKRRTRIIVNAIRCKKCGETLNSKYTHDFVTCKCWDESGGREGCFCDGGLEYFRRGGDPENYEDVSVVRPYTDEERDEYNARLLEQREKFGDWVKIDLME